MNTVGELRALISELPDDMPLLAYAECGHVICEEPDVYLGEHNFGRWDRPKVQPCLSIDLG